MKKILIIAPTGSFGSVERAAESEEQVDWQAPEGPDHEGCVLSFAAVEITTALAQIPDVSVELRGSAQGQALDQRAAAPGAQSTGGQAGATTSGTAAGVNDVRVELNTCRGLDAEEPLVPDEPQSFAIRTESPLSAGSTPGGTVTYRITGRDVAGALYGAYEFLARLGFSWLSPDPWDEIVPAELELPAISVSESPSFLLRGFWATDDRGDEPFLLWMARNKLNLWSAEQPNKAFCRKLGIRFTTGGHGIFARYADPADYFEEHPEWYGLQEVARSADIRGNFGDNICFANAEARRHIADSLADDLASGEWRWVDLINVWALDNGRYCQCDACGALGSPTDQILLLAHDCRQAILRARAEGRIHREVLVSIPAYHETLDPPSKPLPDDFDHEGIIATFFPIERCFYHSFADPACAEINSDLRHFWERWTANPSNPFRGSMLVGEYYNVSSYAGISAVFSQTMAADIPYYYATGARLMHYMHVPVANWGTLALANFQFACQLWDHTVSADRILDRYFDGRYGPVATVMRDAYRLLEESLSNAKPLKHYAGMNRATLRRTLARPAVGNPTHTDTIEPTEGRSAQTQPEGSGPRGRRAASDVSSQPVSPLAFEDRLFETQHLRYGNRGVQSGASLTEIVDALDTVARLFERAQMRCTDVAVAQRLAADLRRVRYTGHTVRFYYHFVRLRLFEAAAAHSIAGGDGDPAAAGDTGAAQSTWAHSARLEAYALRDEAEALRRETVVPKMTPGKQGLDWYRFYVDGLAATWLADAYAEVASRYDLLE